MPAFWRVTASYLLTWVAASLALVALNMLMIRVFNLDLPSGVSIVTMMVPAMIAGQTFRRRTGRLHQSREAWLYALWFAVVQIAIAVPIAVFLLAEFLSRESDGLVLVAVVAVVMALIVFLTSRVFFAMGAKQLDKQGSKG